MLAKPAHGSAEPPAAPERRLHPGSGKLYAALLSSRLNEATFWLSRVPVPLDLGAQRLASAEDLAPEVIAARRPVGHAMGGDGSATAGTGGLVHRARDINRVHPNAARQARVAAKCITEPNKGG